MAGRPRPGLCAGFRLAGELVFGFSLFLEFLFCTLYLALAPERAKRVFRVIFAAFNVGFGGVAGFIKPVGMPCP